MNLLTTKSVDYLNHLFTGVKRNVSYNPSRKLCNCESPTEGSRPAGWETLICRYSCCYCAEIEARNTQNHRQHYTCMHLKMEPEEKKACVYFCVQPKHQLKLYN